jgi:hypothetical protein
VLTFRPSGFAKPLSDSLDKLGHCGPAQKADPPHLPRLLCLGGERRGEGRGQRGQQEAAAVHAGMVGRMRAKVNKPTELLGHDLTESSYLLLGGPLKRYGCTTPSWTSGRTGGAQLSGARIRGRMWSPIHIRLPSVGCS